MRPDIYLEAMKEMGVTPKVAPTCTKFTLFDGITSTRQTRRSTRRRFPINSLRRDGSER